MSLLSYSQSFSTKTFVFSLFYHLFRRQINIVGLESVRTFNFVSLFDNSSTNNFRLFNLGITFAIDWISASVDEVQTKVALLDLPHISLPLSRIKYLSCEA